MIYPVDRAIHFLNNWSVEDKVDIRWSRASDSWYQERNISRRLPVTLAVWRSHVAPDPSAAKEAGYRLAKDMRPINHLLFMDDLKLYGAIKDQLDSLIQVVRIFSEDIKMSFGLESALSWKLEKGRVDKSGIDLPDDQRIEEVEEGVYRYLGSLQLDQTLSTKTKRQDKSRICQTS